MPDTDQDQTGFSKMFLATDLSRTAQGGLSLSRGHLSEWRGRGRASLGVLSKEGSPERPRRVLPRGSHGPLQLQDPLGLGRRGPLLRSSAPLPGQKGRGEPGEQSLHRWSPGSQGDETAEAQEPQTATMAAMAPNRFCKTEAHFFFLSVPRSVRGIFLDQAWVWGSPPTFPQANLCFLERLWVPLRLQDTQRPPQPRLAETCFLSQPSGEVAIGTPLPRYARKAAAGS